LLQKIFSYKFGQSRYFYPYANFDARTVKAAPAALRSGGATAESISLGMEAMPSFEASPESADTSVPLSSGPGISVEAGTELSLSARERAIWNFIKEIKLCRYVPNTRYYANT